MRWKSHESLIKNLKDDGSGSAVFATMNVRDLDGDVTMPGAFGTQTVKIHPAHDWSVPNIGWGKTREEGDLAIVDFQLNLKMASAQEWYQALKGNYDNGVRQEWSYGFTIKDSSFGDFQGQQARFLKALQVNEASPVLMGAGVGTNTRVIKSGDRTMDAHAAEISELIEEFIARSKALAALRLKEGRTLSRATRDRLSRLQTEIMTLLAETDKPEEPPVIPDEEGKTVNLALLDVELVEANLRRVLGG